MVLCTSVQFRTRTKQHQIKWVLRVIKSQKQNVNILTEAFAIKTKFAQKYILTKFVMFLAALMTTVKTGIQILANLAIDVNSILKMVVYILIQGGIFPSKVARILQGSLELSGEVLSKNHALLSRF